MDARQKRVLWRILAAALLLEFVPASGSWRMPGLYTISYLLIGYDILRKVVRALHVEEVKIGVRPGRLREILV